MRIDERKVLSGPYMAKFTLLVSAVVIELGIGAVCLLALLHARDINTHYVPTRRTQ